MLENIREAFDGIRSNLLRSMLTMLGIIIGIASIIAISSTIMGTNERIKQNLIGAGNNAVTVQLYQGSSQFQAGYMSLPDGVPAGDAETLAAIQSLKGVESAAYFCSRNAYGTVYHAANGLQAGNVYGVDRNYFTTYGYQLTAGRGFTETDFTSYRKVALLDATAVDALFQGASPIGQTIELQGEPFTVIGTFASSSSLSLSITSLEDYQTYASSRDGTVLIPLAVWPVVYQYDEPCSVAIRTRNTDDMTTVGKAAAALMNAGITASSSDYQYKSESLLEQATEMQELSSATSRQLILVAAISLLVGGIGVMNIMLVSVTERTPEIGLRKALGAKRSSLRAQFLVEAGVLTSIGGVLGVIVGVVLAYVISRVSGVPILLSPYIMVGAVVFSFLIGMTFGLAPAMKAAKLNPIEALRHE